MKHIKKVVTLFLAFAMVLSMSAVSVFAAAVPNEHTITVNNTDANGNHTYEAYQVFKGNLNANETILSDITWGEGVDGDAILAALVAANADSNSVLKGKFADLKVADPDATPPVKASTAVDVAKDIAKLGDDSTELDAVAKIIGDHLTSTKYAFSGSKDAKYTATVPTDGYYFIKDTTTKLPDGDTASKFMLNVVKDVEVNAKDTSMKPDKEIKETSANVKAGTAAIGDKVTFQVAIQVPDTTNYKKDFWFIMNDKLPEGLTFNKVDSIKTYAAADIDTTANYKVKSGATATATLENETDYAVTAAAKDSETYAAYTAPADKNAAVIAEGGQKIKVVFKDFKQFAETKVGDKNHIGEYVVIEYTAYVNDDAKYGVTGNKNEVTFTYSNDPNHDYDGDEPGPGSTDPTGVTPKDETKTYVTALEILKVDGSNKALEGATFEITGTAYNLTLVTAEKYTAADDGTYWKLKDGSYTTTDPETEGMNKTQYESTTQKYKKETVNKTVTEPVNTKITAISGADGKINVSGLKPGIYTVKETIAPDGYNLDSTEHKLVIEWTAPQGESASGGFALGDDSTEDWSMQENGALYKIQIQNNQGSVLPSTGGIGTVIFYVLGSLLVVGCGIVLISKRRMNSTK